MIIRTLLSAFGGIIATTSLLFIMQLLIATGDNATVDPRPLPNLVFNKVREDEDVTSTQSMPEPPDKPLIPPKTRQRASGDDVLDISVSFHGPTHYDGGITMVDINQGDGPLINIMKVSPSYPARAAERGLEGTVLVQYDVTPEGRVTNVVVLESSNSVFDKAAIAAAYRFKYKPKTVNGVPLESKGLRNLFRFEMEK